MLGIHHFLSPPVFYLFHLWPCSGPPSRRYSFALSSYHLTIFIRFRCLPRALPCPIHTTHLFPVVANAHGLSRHPLLAQHCHCPHRSILLLVLITRHLHPATVSFPLDTFPSPQSWPSLSSTLVAYSFCRPGFCFCLFVTQASPPLRTNPPPHSDQSPSPSSDGDCHPCLVAVSCPLASFPWPPSWSSTSLALVAYFFALVSFSAFFVAHHHCHCGRIHIVVPIAAIHLQW